ncbi:cilia- and flagella-associated protein 70-like isoform X5 [Branchiostoma lanceolatum]|uniref:cilia- and flagella-associated protein 70-like isoform X5 n=1 Tax=Branchiostoma lanceolatum TaxID=7740 RepID=UPI003451FFFA
MADMDDGRQVRPTETINITVLRSRHLKGSKGDVLTSHVKAEFGTTSLGESAKIESSGDTAAEYNFNCNVQCDFDGPEGLDSIAHKPVLLTVIEVLPKEKKQKEEKTVVLGQCTVDLLPLLRGEIRHKATLALHPVVGSPLENLPSDLPKPELDILVTVQSPLLYEENLADTNLLRVTVESAFSLPDPWTPTPAPQFNYTVTLPLPVTAEKEVPVVFANGLLKPGQEKEPPQKKWMTVPNAQSGASFIPDSFLTASSYDEEDGDFRTKEDRSFRVEAESEKPKVVWNVERRCYLEQGAVTSFQNKIAMSRVWPVEIMRTPIPQASKGKGKKHLTPAPSAMHLGRASISSVTSMVYSMERDDDVPASFHGVAYVDMAPLLYPGVKKIRGAYKVMAFNEHEVFEKTKRTGGVAQEAARIASGLSRSTATPAKASKDGKEGKPKEGGKKPSTTKAADGSSSDMADQQAPPNLEGQQYVEARSYLILEFVLDKPLVPKRPPEELAKKVAEYIPPRPLFPRRTNGAQRAVEDFHTQVAGVANLLLDEFRELFGEEFIPGQETPDPRKLEERRKKLIYELNTSGKYFAFKEQLKHAVVKIVREKYLKTTAFASKEELQAFLSELYVYLVDQMHVGLSKVVSLEDQAPVPEPLTDSAQLKHFAREAEVNENFQLAERYYQERLARNRSDPDHWFDYGCFCLLTGNHAKAEECFKETVSIDQQHLPGLLLYGIVSAMEERHEMAETFFENATCVESDNVVAWTLLGLFYDGLGNDIRAEMAFSEANKLNVQAAIHKRDEEKAAMRRAHEEEGRTSVSDAGEREEGTPRESGEDVLSVPKVMETAATPTGDGAGAAAAAAAASVPPGSVKSSSSVAGSAKKGSVINQEKHGSQPAESVASRREGEGEGSRHSTPEVVREPTPVPSTSVYMQAVEFLLEVKATKSKFGDTKRSFAERALAHELLAKGGGPSAEYNVALARLHMQKKEYADAEACLKEATSMDFQNPDAWAMTGHLNYMRGDMAVAKDCYDRTLSFVRDAQDTHAIYLRLASICLQDAEFEKAKNTFLLACKHSPSCVSWLGVGIACYRLGELSEAEDALSEANILNNADPEVWGYLSLVCLQTGRQLEAEQAYKYAIKVGLHDEGLMSEIHDMQQTVGFGDPSF